MIRKRKEEMIRTHENPLGNNKEMKVCEICGALQTVNDTEKRLQTHLDGKIHKGFEKMREEIIKLRIQKEEIRSLLQADKNDKKSKKTK